MPFGSAGDGRNARYGSSLSPNSKSNRSWERGESIGNRPLSASDEVFSYTSSPADSLQNHHLTLPKRQRFIEEHVRDSASGPLIFSRLVEGTLGPSSFNGSTSSRSDGSEYEPTSRSYGPTRHSLSNRRSFMSKPIHPLLFQDHIASSEGQNCSVSSTISSNNLHSDWRSIRPLPELRSLGSSDAVSNPQIEQGQCSGTSSLDFMDDFESLEAEAGPLYDAARDVSRCGLCLRLLSQRPPLGSHRIIRGGDMPVASVLSCWHVYHAECLETITPKTCKHDPPCPLCAKLDKNVPDKWTIRQMKNGIPNIRSPGGGPSNIWSCAQVGDCVEGALHLPKQNKMVLLCRDRLKRQLSSNETSAKARAENMKKSVFRPPDFFPGGRRGGQRVVESRVNKMVIS